VGSTRSASAQAARPARAHLGPAAKASLARLPPPASPALAGTPSQGARLRAYLSRGPELPRAPHPALLRFAALSRAAGHGVTATAGRCTTAADSPPRRPPGQAEAAMSFTWTRCTSLASTHLQSIAGTPSPP
jgi:hypothetical protein